jgi:hypothetical protein
VIVQSDNATEPYTRHSRPRCWLSAITSPRSPSSVCCAAYIQIVSPPAAEVSVYSLGAASPGDRGGRGGVRLGTSASSSEEEVPWFSGGTCKHSS